MLLYSMLLCKKIARAPGVHKKFMLNKLGGGGGGGGGQNRIDPKSDNLLTRRLLKTERPHEYLRKLIHQLLPTKVHLGGNTYQPNKISTTSTLQR